MEVRPPSCNDRLMFLDTVTETGDGLIWQREEPVTHEG
jgi:hypothetical protein